MTRPRATLSPMGGALYDVGGVREWFGRIPVETNELVFHHRWEGRTFGSLIATNGMPGIPEEAFRWTTEYPPNPPSIGDPNTITSRTVLYVTMIAISGAAAAAAYRLRKVYARRWSSDVATGVAIASYIAIVVVAELILPSVDETLKGFPADTLWRFREASIGIPVPSYGRPSASDSARSRRGCLRASRSSRTGSASTKRHGPDAEAHDHHQREPSDT